MVTDTRLNAAAGSGVVSRMADCPSAEFELLLLCVRMRHDAPIVHRIRTLLAGSIDWDTVIPTAHQHRVLPLLCRGLERTASDLVPEVAMRRLRTASHANARRNLLFTGELLRLIDLLSRNGIPCIPYKGPVLATRVYGDISLRQFADLDIFLQRSDIPRAQTLLSSNGYGPGQKMSTDKDLNLRRDDLDIELEVHWGATSETDPIQLDPARLWLNLDSIPIAGKSVLAHGYEDLLLIQCIHGVKHGWEKLGWVCDIAEIVRAQPALEWSRVIKNATALGGRRILFLALTLAQELLGAEPPSDVVAAMREDAVLIPLSIQVKTWLFSGQPPSLGEREQFFIRLREHPADKLRVAFRQARYSLALTPRDAEAFPLPAYLKWTLYIIRPFRLARDYGLSPFLRFVRGGVSALIPSDRH
jgi:hypothetical protein